ncbi:MAG TPA: type I-U CRISPR-associated protein Cas8c [Gemmatimonadaceae bacterium]|nr:type I-U CRISPR-associated protein Cas8c [Gemmatimonadaceae bacterium]
MTTASIPVDVSNPGQVFACLGFLEVASVLLGNAEGGFEWSAQSSARFEIAAEGEEGDDNPFRVVLDFLVNGDLKLLVPTGYSAPKAVARNVAEKLPMVTSTTYPAADVEHLVLPVRFERNGRAFDMSHWCDSSSRNQFKLFAGQQRSAAIVKLMVDHLKLLWRASSTALTRDPLGMTLPLGGSTFKLDARKAWTTIDIGYSPDEQAHHVEASPVVELLGAIGLEHARPDEYEPRKVRYGVWERRLPSMLARAALGGSYVGVRLRVFRFTLDLAGKNKIVTFAEEETSL